MLFMTCLGHELVAINILTKLSTLAATRNSQAVQVMNKLQNATLTKVWLCLSTFYPKYN